MKKKILPKKINKGFIIKYFLFVSSVVIIVLLYPTEGTFKYDFQKGKPWKHETLFAPFDFSIIKPQDEIEKERQALLDDFSPYYRYSSEKAELGRKELITKLDEIYSNTKDTLNEHTSDDLWEDFELLKARITSIFDTIFAVGIIEKHKVLDELPEDSVIQVAYGNILKKRKFENFLTISEADEIIRDSLQNFTERQKPFLQPVLQSLLTPNVLFDKETTSRFKEKMLNNISPTRGMIQNGEKIIAQGELVTMDKYLMLESLKKEYEQSIGSSHRYTSIIAGEFILVIISMIVLYLFLVSFRKDVYESNKKLLFLLILIILNVLITSLVAKHNVDILYLIPICIVPIIVRVFFDTRLALFVHIVVIILVGFLVPNSFEFVFLQLIAGIIAIVSIIDIRSRSVLFVTAGLVFLTYSAIFIGLNLMQEGTLENIQWITFGLFGGSALLTLFTYPLIFIFEKTFGFITDISLLELQDMNNTLLKTLSEKASGSMQHSLQVANIAEHATQLIGGNSLLARTGALYHDIGKTYSPQYFIENQMNSKNPHDKLDSYEESAKIIIKHVTYGVELAKKHGLPSQIIDFIRTHHGTTQVKYFYNMDKNENPDKEIDIKKYTYPGPVPFSKETAVVMMADSIEAASRSLKTYTEKSIGTLIDKIIDAQIELEQFHNTDITYRDITILRKEFKVMIKNIYHVRVEYPEEKK